MRTQAVTGIDLKASSCFQLSIGFGRAGSNPVAFGVFCGRFSIGAFDMKSRSAQLCSKQTEPEFLVLEVWQSGSRRVRVWQSNSSRQALSSMSLASDAEPAQCGYGRIPTTCEAGSLFSAVFLDAAILSPSFLANLFHSLVSVGQCLDLPGAFSVVLPLNQFGVRPRIVGGLRGHAHRTKAGFGALHNDGQAKDSTDVNDIHGGSVDRCSGPPDHVARFLY